MNFGLYEDEIKAASSFVERPLKDFSILTIPNKKDCVCGIWCIIARLQLVKVNACRTKVSGKHFNTLKATGINLEI